MKLTVRALEAMKPGEILRDSTCRGFFAEAGRTGVSLKVQADLRAGPRRAAARAPTTVRMTLGRWPALPLDRARAEAMRLLAEVKAGRDPRPAASPETWTVGHAFDRYCANLAKRFGSGRTAADMTARLRRYLDDWRTVPLATLTRDALERRQADIAAGIRARARSPRYTGATQANATIRDICAVWNFAADFTTLGPNPAARVAALGERNEHHEIAPGDLAAWYRRVQALANPIRRAMHELGLFSALRPGNLMRLERAWLRLDAQRIVFPAQAMKRRREFMLPLSAHMVRVVERALAAGDVLYPGTPWLFPARGGGPTGQVREEGWPGQTGHALRHTWKTCARLARVPEVSIELLLAHRLGGMSDTYGSLEGQFDRLLEDQETVTAWILKRLATQ